MKKKLGFALGAGGSRGCAHIGFLKAMEESGIRPDYISGTSMGSVVGACYSAGMTPNQMIEAVKKLKLSDIFDLSFNPLGSGALLRSEKMLNKLKQFLGEKTFEDLIIPFRCVATDLVKGKSVVFSGKRTVAECVAASSTIPSVFRPVTMDDMVLVDGAVTCRVPIHTVREMGAEVVIAVDVLGKIRPSDKKYNLLSVLLRTFDIADSELTRYKTGRQRADMFLEPDLGDMNQYKFKDIAMAIEKGYELGHEHAEHIKELINQAHEA